jgi:nicotinamidase-related amidase
MSRTALVVIDMLSPYDYEDAEKVAESAERTIGPIRSLIEWASADEDVEIIYVNDNYSDWDSSREELIENALNGERPDLVEPILPPQGSSFVLKARHTIFYGTPLEYMLWQRNVERLVLVGQVTEQCILYSALDAYVRHYEVTVPRDCVAHIYEHLAQAAFEMMERNLGARIPERAEGALMGT